LRFDRIAQHRCLLRDGGAAEENHAGQQPREHQADNCQPQRMRQAGNVAEQFGHGVERDAEQHSREDQKQRRGEVPGKQQQGCKCDDADAAHRYRPCQIVAGRNTAISRDCHIDSFSSRT